jgi:tetratricopeptide (TPR) repeat protein
VAAVEAMPELAAARVSLGHVYFAMEDLDLARETYHAAVDAVPGQREALFGEAKSLSVLGRHAEAVAVLDRMVELGTWYQGEAHYWRAWNRYRLREYEAADGDVAGARSRLPMDVQVDKLAGQIALARNDPDRAEREFRAALQHMIDKGDRDCDVRYLLGSVLVMRKAWAEAAPQFSSAVPCYADAEASTRRRIDEIRVSDLPDDRKARLVAAKERAAIGLQDHMARAAFNGAAAFYNGGEPQNAKPLAERAASHPELGEQARALLARIK